MQTALMLPVPRPVPAPIAPPPTGRMKVTLPKAVATKEPAPSTDPNPSILFGLDQRGRAHAACFVGADTAALERAADLMDLFLVTADTDALRDLGANLPVGRLFPASGKAFVPFTSAAFYKRLLAAAGITEAPRPVKAAGKAADAPPAAGAESGGSSGSDGGDGPAAKRPGDWASIGIGSVVLACQGPMEGWWEAVVKFTKTPDSFVLSWRDFPSDGEIVRARKDLGLLPLDSLAGLR